LTFDLRQFETYEDKCINEEKEDNRLLFLSACGTRTSASILCRVTEIMLTVYWYVNQHLIHISYREDCSTRAESLKQKVQDAIACGMPFKEWNRIYQPEVERLNAECNNMLKK
jgi:hypothetical protein